jgi:hypothetical protein
MEKYSYIKDSVVFHEVSLSSIAWESSTLVLQADDENEIKKRLQFSPIQAFKLITNDCWINRTELIKNWKIIEVENSTWIYELQKNAQIIDNDADFLDKSKHYIIPLCDAILEIVFWNMSIENIV